MVGVGVQGLVYTSGSGKFRVCFIRHVGVSIFLATARTTARVLNVCRALRFSTSSSKVAQPCLNIRYL